MYDVFIRPIVRLMNPERGSKVALRYFRFLGSIPGERFVNRLLHNNKASGIEREVFGIQFYNPLGLGAGLDVFGELYNDLNDLGFSFVEIGPFADRASMRRAIANIQKDPQDDILAACISGEHLISFSLAYDFCDFFVIDPGDAPYKDVLEPLLDARLTSDTYKPVVLKVSESIDSEDLALAAEYCLANNVDGIELRSLAQVEAVHASTRGRLPIIANCHINTPQQAETMLSAGASLVEIRSGLVTNGPSLVTKILHHLERSAKNASNEPNKPEQAR